MNQKVSFLSINVYLINILLVRNFFKSLSEKIYFSNNSLKRSFCLEKMKLSYNYGSR